MGALQLIQLKYTIRIKGSIKDLEKCVEVFRGPEIIVKHDGFITDANREPVEAVYSMRGALFESHVDSITSDRVGDGVYQQLVQTFGVLNGLLKIYFPWWEGIKWAACHLEDPTGAFIVTVMGPGSFQFIGPDTHQDPESGLPALVSAERVIALAARDPDVDFAIRAFSSLPHYWSTLQVIIDCIGTNVGGKQRLYENAWVTRRDLNRITQAAHQSRAIEEGPRHGKRVLQKSASEPITMGDAYRLVTLLLEKWILHRLRMSAAE